MFSGRRLVCAALLIFVAVLGAGDGDTGAAGVVVLGSTGGFPTDLPGAGGAAPLASLALPAEDRAAARLDQIRWSPEELRAFFLAMPKGGDLHNHLTGAVYTESLIDQAASKGLCVDPETCDLRAPPCREDEVFASEAYGNSKLYGRLVDDWSMRNHDLLPESGHDHFFAVFPEIAPATGNVGAILAELKHRAAVENVQYLEIMLSEYDSSSSAAALGEKAGSGSLQETYDRLVDGGLKDLAWNASMKIERWDSDSISFLKCGTVDADPGCNVTVRYIYHATRGQAPGKVFGQLALAFEVARASPLVVGINLVGPEDEWRARENYSLHMEMISFLSAIYTDVPVALHAGELAPGLVPPEDMRFHIRDAVLTANASRIGHGVDIMSEIDSEDTMELMAEKRVCVEVMPVSNEEILGVSGPDHPLPVYVERGVPVVLASDDPGILRTDLTEQFVLAAYRYPGLKYADFKGFIRNSLDYSFMQGAGIWASKGVYTSLRPELQGCDPVTGTLTPAGQEFLKGSEKAGAEWRLEAEMAEFEERVTD